MKLKHHISFNLLLSKVYPPKIYIESLHLTAVCETLGHGYEVDEIGFIICHALVFKLNYHN